MAYSQCYHIRKRKGSYIMTKELLKKTEELMAKAETAALTSIDENGYPRTATMSSLKTEGVDTVWFSTGTSSHKTVNYKRNSKASVCYNLNGNNVTLTGDVVIVDDMNIKKQMWLDWFIKHFPKGVDDPEYCILKFETKYIQAYIDDEFDEVNIK